MRQLRLAGLSGSAIGRRVAAGRLHRVHRGVYAVGHPGLGAEGEWLAAVLACGDGAVLSHRSAAELWGILEPRGGPAHVIVPAPGGRSPREGIRIHRFPGLSRRETTRRHGIPVTTPARTLADLRSVVEPRELRRAIREAEYGRLVVGRQAPPSDRTASELEDRFLRLCRRARLPEPEVNVRMLGFEVDFLWRAEELVVETDGYRSHAGRQAFEDDRVRDAALVAAGYRVLRFTYARITDRPADVVATVRAALGDSTR